MTPTMIITKVGQEIIITKRHLGHSQSIKAVLKNNTPKAFPILPKLNVLSFWKHSPHPAVFRKKDVLKKFHKIRRKTHVSESLF